MTRFDVHSRWPARLAIRAAVLCALAIAAPAAQASEYHHTAWDIGTNYSRLCMHGLNGAPLPPSLHLREVETETSVLCQLGSSGQPATMYANLYMNYAYGTEVEGLGVGGSHYNGTCSVTGQYCNVIRRNQVLNVPTRFEAVAWTTYLLPTTGTESFIGYPTEPRYDCSAYWRNHDALNGWHLSGLTCFGEGVFVSPAV